MAVRLYPHNQSPELLENLAGVPPGTFQCLIGIREQYTQRNEPGFEGYEAAKQYYAEIFADPQINALDSQLVFSWGRLTPQAQRLASQLLNPPVKIEEHRGWAVWWCSFHQDAARSGKSKRANFGLNFAPDGGYWKCLRCGAHGSNLKKLRQQLGVYQPPPVVTEIINAKPQVSQLEKPWSKPVRPCGGAMPGRT